MNKKILIVDDTEINIEILLGLLDAVENYDVMVALEGESALEIAHEEHPHLILLDIMMPNMDGFEVCRRLKASKTTQNIPIIFITAKTDEQSIEEAYEIGGIDYVSKPFKPVELLARVNRELKMQELIYNLQRTQKELKFLVSIDCMTKLYNRQHFTEMAQHLLSLSKRNERNLSIMMLDIDDFKLINDSYGHKTGDKVIIQLSERLRNLTRKSDIISRWGGEEFVILLPDTNIKGAKVISERIRKEISTMPINIEGSKKTNFTVSIGISKVIYSDANIETSIHRADLALYQAKEGGKNKVCLHS